MACSPIIILDSGCLDKEVIQLQCKGEGEAVYYQFSLANRIGDQTLLNVRATANADDVAISNITVDGQTFKCLISGGTIYHNVGLYFVATTSGGETRTFNAVLPIRPEGVMNIPGDGTVVIMGTAGAPGVKGDKGDQGDKGDSPVYIKTLSITDGGVSCSMSDGSTIKADIEGIYVQDGLVIVPDKTGVLPDDFILNGNIYTAPNTYVNGTKQLPTGLSLNSNVVMTDGSVFFPKTINNNGVLCAA